jgi:hypothetical protein
MREQFCTDTISHPSYAASVSMMARRVSAERASRGYERAAGGYGGLPLRRVLRGDGSQARGAGPTRQGVGASHLCVRRVWP